MTIQPITNTHPACYGVMCPKHGQCARYALVEQTSSDDTIATCDHAGDGARPMFLAVEQTEVAA